MRKIFAVLLTVLLLQACNRDLTIQGTVSGADGTRPEFCMLMLIGTNGVLHTAHFVPPEFKITLAVSTVRLSQKLVVDCGGYSRIEMPINSNFNGALGALVLVPSDGT